MFKRPLKFIKHSKKAKMQETKQSFDELLSSFKEQNELSEKSTDLLESCKIGLRKIRIAKEFAHIDEELIKKSTANDRNDDFFSGILFLEAKRLAFKEESVKCQDQKIKTLT